MFKGNVQDGTLLSNPIVGLTYEQGLLFLTICTRREQNSRYLTGSSSLNGSLRISDVVVDNDFSDTIIDAVKRACTVLIPSIVFNEQYLVNDMTQEITYARYCDLD